MSDYTRFQSTIIIVPGYTGSGPHHWQSLWEDNYGFRRVSQDNWDRPVCEEWLGRMDDCLKEYDLNNTLLVGHSLGCIAIVLWAQKYKRLVKGALLVAPCDTEAKDFPEVISGFSPMPLVSLPFQSILVASANDPFLPEQNAFKLAAAWGSAFVNIGAAGHINTASGHGSWKEGLDLLNRLDSMP